MNTPPPRLKDSEYEQIKRLTIERTGNTTFESKRYLVEQRLAGILEDNGFHSYQELLRRINTDQKLLDAVLSALTIHESFFFRDQYPFDFLTEVLLPQVVQEKRPLRIWSACCSDGQECWSLAITALEYARLHPSSGNWLNFFRILGTDISTSSLDYAEKANYSRFQLSRGLKPDLLSRYFDLGEGSDCSIKRELRPYVRFRAHNLLEPCPFAAERFDLIFCRYALIYLAPEVRQRALKALLTQLQPGGYFITDPAAAIQLKHENLVSEKFGNQAIFKKQ